MSNKCKRLSVGAEKREGNCSSIEKYIASVAV